MSENTIIADPPEMTANPEAEEITSGLASELSAADVKHNVKVNVLLDAIWSVGAADFAVAAGPMYVFLRASNTYIGMVNSLAVCALLGVILMPYISVRFPFKKWLLFVVHIPYIGAYGTLGVCLLMSQRLGLSDAQLLKYIFAIMAANFVFSGFVTLPHQEFLAACIPMSYRGRYTGISLSVGSVGAIASSAVGGLILLHVAKPQAFGYLFILAWALFQTGYIMCLFAKEPRTPVENAPKPWTKRMFRALWHDKPFLRVVLLNFLFFTTINPIFMFVPIYGYRELHMIPATAATISIVQQLVRAIFGSHVGIYTDRLGPKLVFPFWLIAAALSFAVLFVFPSSYGVYISVGLSALCFVGAMASFNALIFGVPSPENRSGHFTTQILFRNISEFVGMFSAGILCDALGYRTVFALWVPLSLAFGVMAWRLLAPLSAHAEDYA